MVWRSYMAFVYLLRGRKIVVISHRIGRDHIGSFVVCMRGICWLRFPSIFRNIYTRPVIPFFDEFSNSFQLQNFFSEIIVHGEDEAHYSSWLRAWLYTFSIRNRTSRVKSCKWAGFISDKTLNSYMCWLINGIRVQLSVARIEKMKHTPKLSWFQPQRFPKRHPSPTSLIYTPSANVVCTVVAASIGAALCVREVYIVRTWTGSP